MKFKPYISVFLTSVLLVGCSNFDDTTTIGGDILKNQDNSLSGYDGTYMTDNITPRDDINGYSFVDAYGGLHNYTDSLFVNGGQQGHRAIGNWGGQNSYVTVQFAPYDDSSSGSIERKTFKRNLEVLDSLNDVKGGNGVFNFDLHFTVNTARSTDDRYNLELFKIGSVAEKDTNALPIDSLKALNKTLSINYGTVSGNSTVGTIPISLDYHSNKASVVDTLIQFIQNKNYTMTVENFIDTLYEHGDSSLFVYGDTIREAAVSMSDTDQAFEASILPYDEIVAYQLPYSHGNHYAIEDSFHVASSSVINNITLDTTTTQTIFSHLLYNYSYDTVVKTFSPSYKIVDQSLTIPGGDTVYKDTTIYFTDTLINKVRGEKLTTPVVTAIDTLIERVGDIVTIPHPKDNAITISAKRSTIYYPAQEYRKAISVVNSTTDTLTSGVIRTLYEKADTVYSFSGNIVNQYEVVDTVTNISIEDLSLMSRAGTFDHIDSVFTMALDFSEFQKDSALLYLSNIKIRTKLTVNSETFYNDFPATFSRMTVTDYNDSTLNSNLNAVSDGGTQRFTRLKLNIDNFWNTVKQNQYRTVLYSDLNLWVKNVELPDYHNDTIIVKGLLLDTLYKDIFPTSNFLAQNREDRIPFTFSVVKDSSRVLIDNQIMTDNLLDILYGDRYKNLPVGINPECYLYLWIEDGHLGRVHWDYPNNNTTQFTYIVQDKK